MRVALIATTFAFSFVSGANDGATLASMSSRSGAFSPLSAILILSASTAGAPLVLGTGVATTLARGIVSFQTEGGRLFLLVAVVSSLSVVLFLAARGLPTSLTLGLTGGIVGVGIAGHLAIRSETIAFVLGAGLLAPLASAAIAYRFAPRLLAMLGTGVNRESRARRLERAAYVLQSLAYGANDAEKLTALLAVATGASLHPLRAEVPGQVAVAAFFAAGALFAVRPVAARVGQQMATSRHEGTLASLLGSSAAVLGGVAAGVPLSSTQAATSALVGGSARLSRWRVRWHEVFSLGAAWCVTLPSAAALAAALTLVLRAAR